MLKIATLSIITMLTNNNYMQNNTQQLTAEDKKRLKKWKTQVFSKAEADKIRSKCIQKIESDPNVRIKII